MGNNKNEINKNKSERGENKSMKKEKDKQNKKLVRKEDSDKSKGKKSKYESNKKLKNKPIKKISFILNNIIGEIIYLKEKKKGAFLVYDRRTGDIKIYNRFKVVRKIYIPDTDSKLIQKNVVMIPNGIEEYGRTKKIVSILRKFIDKYVYIEDAVDKEIIITYILLTWVYERFTVIPYLRVLGDFGTGKSRLLKVLNVCNKSIYTSGNASAAPIFRLIDKYKGTLIIDEAEFGKNTERNEDIKEILRFGKDSDGVVVRCHPRTNEPIPYEVFGPKILGSRRSYSDDALESRIISIKITEAKGNDIPIMLEKEKFKKICEAIRQRLLL